MWQYGKHAKCLIYHLRHLAYATMNIHLYRTNLNVDLHSCTLAFPSSFKLSSPMNAAVGDLIVVDTISKRSVHASPGGFHYSAVSFPKLVKCDSSYRFSLSSSSDRCSDDRCSSLSCGLHDDSWRHVHALAPYTYSTCTILSKLTLILSSLSHDLTGSLGLLYSQRVPVP